ncbi:hypothetical protein F2Q70_00042280 [Brassica cretica]|uniref:Uncharacterized protein n=1 Tax=Brassica cretica TaxID=69181 RepID=A0A8S9KFL3_BRACR|nr:hypothetical protein F2Q70_00042280 [Brassica cretica]
MELPLRKIRECTDLGRTRCSMFEIVRSLRSDRVLDGRSDRVLDGRSDQTNGLVGRYVATDSIADRSLRSDRPRGLVGRYVATESLATDPLQIGRYVPTNREAWSVAT